MTNARDKMTIEHVTSTLCEPLGGAELYCIRVAVAQAASAHVRIRVSAIDDSVRAALENSGVEVVVSKVWRPYRPDHKGRNVLSKVIFQGLDFVGSVIPPFGFARRLPPASVIHVHRFQGLGASILRQRVPVVHTVHDYALVDTSATSMRSGVQVHRLGVVQRTRARLNSWAAQRAIIVFPSARTMSRHFELGLRVNSSQCRVVPHGWDLPSWEGNTDQSVDPPYFLFVGKLSPSKGIEVLLAAWGDGIPGYELVVAGDGPLRAKVESLSAPGLRFVGWVEGQEKSMLIRRAHALVFPSTWPENFPLVVAESMVAGVPVVANSLSSDPLVVDGQNGVVAEGIGSLSLRRTMELVAASPSLRDKLADGAAKVGDSLSMESHISELRALYEQLIQVRESVIGKEL